MTHPPSPPPLLITMGDAAGIGPEIIAKLFRDHAAELRGCVVVGDVATLRRAAALVADPLALPVAQLADLQASAALPPHCLPVLQPGADLPPVPWGQISGQAGQAAADAIVWAARQVLAGQALALVTAPIHKEALAAAGGWAARFPGHTEMLQAEAAAFLGQPVTALPVRMMLSNGALTVVLVSIHLALKQAIEAVTVDNVLQTLRITHAALTPRLGRPARIAVAGLNPHAGEGGRFGDEELTVIAPAISQARAEGLDVHGPFAPDTVFMRARQGADKAAEFDVVVAMYHDQGLIPIKYLGLEQGVNITLGLPLLRTSPDHGTAFDIAGTGQADPSSLLAAIRWARQWASPAIDQSQVKLSIDRPAASASPDLAAQSF